MLELSEAYDESINGKKLLNPLTNQAFSTDDDNHIRSIAAQRSIAIEDVMPRQTSNAIAFFHPWGPYPRVETNEMVITAFVTSFKLSQDKETMLRKAVAGSGDELNYLDIDLIPNIKDIKKGFDFLEMTNPQFFRPDGDSICDLFISVLNDINISPKDVIETFMDQLTERFVEPSFLSYGTNSVFLAYSIGAIQ